ncbi:hypothetical protein, partial [Borreliella garinii]|uniref:hypothetical protein n=1 Tax=Borreliella garinii TaxID=29519 RepID=UPI001AEFD96E
CRSNCRSRSKNQIHGGRRTNCNLQPKPGLEQSKRTYVVPAYSDKTLSIAFMRLYSRCKVLQDLGGKNDN